MPRGRSAISIPELPDQRRRERPGAAPLLGRRASWPDGRAVRLADVLERCDVDDALFTRQQRPHLAERLVRAGQRLAAASCVYSQVNLACRPIGKKTGWPALRRRGPGQLQDVLLPVVGQRPDQLVPDEVLLVVLKIENVVLGEPVRPAAARAARRSPQWSPRFRDSILLWSPSLK